jgi:hypothetical protein
MHLFSSGLEPAKVHFTLRPSHVSDPGLPDFSWYNIPKREKYTK